MQPDDGTLAFGSSVAVPARRAKPRDIGLTMMMDWGLGRARVADHLDLVGAYVDLVKIVVGTARLYPKAYLQDKLRLYKERGVAPFLGGQFTEYVLATQGMQAIRPFFVEAKGLGFDAIEISDNCVPLSEAERRRLIGLGLDAGLEIHGEVGSKVVKQDAAELIAQARSCFDAGCHVVLVEGAELVEADGTPKRDLVDALKGELDARKVLFELTGPWIAGVTLDGVHRLKRFLVGEFGPDVNLANVMPDDVLETEALRLGLSVTGPSAAGPPTPSAP